MVAEKQKKNSEEKVEEKRDEELDVANVVEKAQNIMRKITGNLLAHQFRLESVRQNGSKTKYIIICSIVPDMGAERDYYFIKVDIETGKPVLPMGYGKLVNGKVRFEEIEIKPEWLE